MTSPGTTASPWIADDVPDLSGRRAVVTGASSGLGRETALELARHGAEVVLAVRDPAKGEQVAQALRSELAAHPVAGVTGGALEPRELDLADLGSVRGFAAAWEGPLHLLVNNAGVMAIPRRESVDGFELQLATNHLGHFALTGLLLPALLRTGTAAVPARVVTVSSNAHRMGRIDLADLQAQRRYRKWAAYGQSKLANLLFAFELARRLAAAAAPVVAYAAHPGFATTNLQSVGPAMSGDPMMGRVIAGATALLGQSAAMGALPLLYAATVPDLPAGCYVGPDGWRERRGHPRLVGSSDRAADAHLAARLWAVSEDLTGVRYDLPAPAS